MAIYNYSARDPKTNKIIKGAIQGTTDREIAKTLIAQGMSVISIKPAKSGRFIDSNHVPNKDKVIFTRQLATLTNAGLPIQQSLTNVANQTQSKALKRIVQIIASNVQGGMSLSKAFAAWPKVFNPVFISLIEVGESSGSLDKSLNRLADQMENDSDMMSKIRGAFIYPAIILIVIIGVVIFLLLTIVPQVKQLYSDLGEPLPLLTQFMVGMAAFLINFWWLVLIILAIAGLLGARYVKTTKGRHTWDTMKLNMPIFGGLFQKLYMARFARTMEILLAAGVHMLEALQISSRSMNNVILEHELIRDSERVKSGKTLSQSLVHKKGEGYVLEFVPQMVSIGEKAGNTDEMLAKTAKYYESEVEETVKNIQTMIEPVMIILMALVAIFVILAVMLPIYNLSSRTSF